MYLPVLCVSFLCLCDCLATRVKSLISVVKLSLFFGFFPCKKIIFSLSWRVRNSSAWFNLFYCLETSRTHFNDTEEGRAKKSALFSVSSANERDGTKLKSEWFFFRWGHFDIFFCINNYSRQKRRKRRRTRKSFCEGDGPRKMFLGHRGQCGDALTNSYLQCSELFLVTVFCVVI